MSDEYLFPDNTEVFRQQQEALARRRQLAKSLIDKSLNTDGQMVSGFYVPKSPWQNALEGAAGGYFEADANTQGKDLAAQQARQQNELLTSIPTEGPERQAAQIRAMQNPSLRDVIKAQMGVDEHEQTRQFRQQEAEAARLEKSEQEAANRVARSEEKEADRQNQRALRAMPTQHINISSGGAGRGSGKPPSGYRWTPDGELEFVPGGPHDPATKPRHLTGAQQKAYDDSDILLGHIDSALEHIDSNPNALGVKTMMPDVALAKIDPEGVATRAAVAGLSAEKVHQLSGAAVSPAEFARLRPYLPSSGDNAKTAKDKLANLRKEVERIKEAHARGPTQVKPQQPGKPAPSDKLTPAEQAELDQLRAKHGRK